MGSGFDPLIHVFPPYIWLCPSGLRSQIFWIRQTHWWLSAFTIAKFYVIHRIANYNSVNTEFGQFYNGQIVTVMVSLVKLTPIGTAATVSPPAVTWYILSERSRL